MVALYCSWSQLATVSFGLLVRWHQTASFHHQAPCAGRLLAASAFPPSVLELVDPSSVVLLRPASACYRAVPAPSSSSAAGEVEVVDTRRTDQASEAVAGSLDTDPSDCRCSCSSAVAAASTSVAADNPETTFQLADDTAAVDHRTAQAHTAAVGCTTALDTQSHTFLV